MKNQFIKNKINQPKKVEKKKKFTKEQLIVFILMIFWTISSIFAWVGPLIKSSSDKTLTAYADSVEEVNDDILNDTGLDNIFNYIASLSDSRYQNIFYYEPFDTMDNIVDIDSITGLVRYTNTEPHAFYGSFITSIYDLSENAFPIIAYNRTTTSNSYDNLYLYLAYTGLNDYSITNKPVFGIYVEFSDGTTYTQTRLSSGIAYKLTDIANKSNLSTGVHIETFNIMIYSNNTETLDFNLLPVIYFGSQAVAVRSYSPLFSNIYLGDYGYQNGYDTGLDDGYQNGYDTGYDTGYQNGYDTGLGDGYQNGYDTGYDTGYDSAFELFHKSFLLDLDYSAHLYFDDGTEFILSNLVNDLDIPLTIDYVNNTISFDNFFSTDIANQPGITRIDISLNFNRRLNFEDYSFLVDFGNPFRRISSSVIYSANNTLYELRNDFLSKYGLTANSLVPQNPQVLDFLVFNTIIFEFENSSLDDKADFIFTITDKSTLDTIFDSYNNGYNQARNEYLGKETYSFTDLITSVVDAPIQALTGLLNFNLPILNINMYNLATSLITLAVLVFILRLIL